jgi:hypothetical protein
MTPGSRVSGMNNTKTITGEPGQCDRPNWEPLLDLLGEELLVAEFLWMSQIDLADGTAVHAYKHILTRRYLHLAEDGRTMEFTRSGRYRTVDPYDLIASVFDGWEELIDDPAELKALRAALRRAYRKVLA